jgi:heme/copper-type cytochrome/quinol oxidase subunit 3
MARLELRVTSVPDYLSSPGGAATPFRAPHRSAVIAMWLFLLSLGMLFIASMLAYVLVRTGLFGQGQQRPALGSLHLPGSLWISTALVLLGSVTIHRALVCVRREWQKPFRGWLAATLAIALAFVIVQTPALGSLIIKHSEQLRLAGNEGRPMALYGAIFFLIVVHALHVVGGIVSLAWVTYRAGQHRYDHEHYLPVKHAALYWHFLDIVWIAMFSLMLILG